VNWIYLVQDVYRLGYETFGSVKCGDFFLMAELKLLSVSAFQGGLSYVVSKSVSYRLHLALKVHLQHHALQMNCIIINLENIYFKHCRKICAKAAVSPQSSKAMQCQLILKIIYFYFNYCNYFCLSLT
jgi:hypothetical protein